MKAIDCLQRSLEVFRNIGFPYGQANALSRLAGVYMALGETGRAAAYGENLSTGALAPPGGSVRVAAARELGTLQPPGRQCRDGSC
jgi:hypothetical protein